MKAEARPAVLIILTLVAFGAVLIGNWGLPKAGAWMVHGPQVQPVPTPATPPEGGVIPPLPTVVPPDANSPWLAPGPAFVNQTLHWSSTSYDFMANGQDPANGQTITGDFWAQVGANGSIVRYHERFTRADGGFLQETAYAGGQTLTVYGPGYPSYPPSGCVAAGASSAPPGSLPPFAADAATLSRLGFMPAGGVTRPLPSTPPLAGVQPIRVYPAGERVQGWERRTALDNGMTTTGRLELGAASRLVAAEGVTTDAEGTVVGISRQTFGELAIYDPSSVPDSVFEIGAGTREACRG